MRCNGGGYNLIFIIYYLFLNIKQERRTSLALLDEAAIFSTCWPNAHFPHP